MINFRSREIEANLSLSRKVHPFTIKLLVSVSVLIIFRSVNEYQVTLVSALTLNNVSLREEIPLIAFECNLSSLSYLSSPSETSKNNASPEYVRTINTPFHVLQW